MLFEEAPTDFVQREQGKSFPTMDNLAFLPPLSLTNTKLLPSRPNIRSTSRTPTTNVPSAQPTRQRPCHHFPTMRSLRGADLIVAIPERVYMAEDLKTWDWKEYDCSQLKGKVVLAVNVASLDEAADYHYGLLVEWYKRYRDRGLEIMAFPNNWHFQQLEPWPVAKVKEHVEKKYGVEFLIMNKSDIDANPIFRLAQTRFEGDIEWNFHGRFLFGRNGYPIARFGLLDEPEMIAMTIEEELAKDGTERDEFADLAAFDDDEVVIHPVLEDSDVEDEEDSSDAQKADQ